ncbi:MAG: HAMP domain-containing sensor histidine kinase [Cyanobacteria bacterium P01_C01_bin.70]
MFSRSRLNLAYWFALSMGSILIAFTGVVYYLEAEDQLRAFDKDLYVKVKEVENRAYYRPKQGDWLLNISKGTTLLGENAPFPQNELVYVRWYGVDGRVIQFVGLAPDQQKVIAPTTRFETIRFDDATANGRAATPALRQLTAPVKYNDRIVGYIQSAVPLHPLQTDLNRALVVLTLSVPVTLGIIGLTGWILGGIAMQPIRQSYDRLQRFTADASHELRNPLAAILSNAQVALIPNIEASSQTDCVSEIETAAKAMSGLIDNLLFLARHEGPIAGAALNQRTSAQELLMPLVHYGTAQANQQHRTFVHDIPLRIVMIKADPQLLRRALTNLLDNAFKYTKENGTIQLRLVIQAQSILIQIKDDGAGIPAADLPRIFERFYRVDTARSRHTGGFGLGLSIAQQIVRAHNGQVTATSTIGQGSLFQVQLPLHK